LVPKLGCPNLDLKHSPIENDSNLVEAATNVDENFHIAYNELEVGNFLLLDYANQLETNCILLIECLEKSNPAQLQFKARIYGPSTRPSVKWFELIKPATKNYFLSWKATAKEEYFFQHNITVSNFRPGEPKTKKGRQEDPRRSIYARLKLKLCRIIIFKTLYE